MSIATRLKTWGVVAIGRWMRPERRHSVLRRGIYRLARVAADAYEAPDYDIARNGEAQLLRRLSRVIPVNTLLDVGANEGLWYQHARAAFPTARIFCVEIAAPLWPGLERRLATDDSAELVKHGLGSQTGTVTFNYYATLPAVSTMYDLGHTHLEATTIEAPVVAGDEFARESEVESIDILKIDVEGAELEVLRGFREMFSRRDINIVQFEYGRANIVSESLLRDFYEFFGGYGYVIGKLMPETVNFEDYRLEMEDFVGRVIVKSCG